MAKTKIKTIRINSSLNYDPKDHPKEKNSGEILTTPGESYTVGQLLEKHRSGLMPDVNRNGIYDNPDSEEDTNPFLNPDLDLVDKQQIQEHINEVKNREQRQQKLALDKKLKSESEAKALETLKEQEKNKNLSKISDTAEQ